jgi:hypothetical protein
MALLNVSRGQRLRFTANDIEMDGVIVRSWQAAMGAGVL